MLINSLLSGGLYDTSGLQCENEGKWKTNSKKAEKALQHEGDTKNSWLSKNSPQGFEKKRHWRNWKSNPYRPKHYIDQLKYLEEFWRPEETCRYSNSSERPSVNNGVKNLLDN